MRLCVERSVLPQSLSPSMLARAVPRHRRLNSRIEQRQNSAQFRATAPERVTPLTTDRSIGKPLTFRATHRACRPHLVINSKLFAIAVTKIELGQIAVQMLFTAMLIDADHP